MRSTLDIKVDDNGNAILPLGSALRGQEVRIAFEVGTPALLISEQENNDVVPAEEQLATAAYKDRIASLFGSWEGDLFEPLDAPLEELGPIF